MARTNSEKESLMQTTFWPFTIRCHSVARDRAKGNGENGARPATLAVSLDAPLVEIDQIGHRPDFSHAIRAAHGGQGLPEKVLPGRGQALLHELTVPTRCPHI